MATKKQCCSRNSANNIRCLPRIRSALLAFLLENWHWKFPGDNDSNKLMDWSFWTHRMYWCRCCWVSADLWAVFMYQIVLAKCLWIVLCVYMYALKLRGFPVSLSIVLEYRTAVATLYLSIALMWRLDITQVSSCHCRVSLWTDAKNRTVFVTRLLFSVLALKVFLTAIPCVCE